MSDEARPGALSPGLLAQMACLIEVTARKPGNIHRGRDFDDCHFVDFLLSAAAIAAPLDRARATGVGAAIRESVEATRRVVATNTNLGMILLLAPLAAVPADTPLPDGVADVLAATTIDDARHVYRAIRLARPGGLGVSPEQDVADEPSVTLLQAMTLAADRDLVARQYANDYDDVFGDIVPALRSALAADQPLETAIVSAYLGFLANHPDTLIARKRGGDEARAVSSRAAEVLDAGWPHRPESRALCEEFDRWLGADGHGRNPGTTADLIAAALFVALRDGTIPLPRPAGSRGWSGPFASPSP
jgi:triphosphoribosyl-dephospho-CoA synthase